MLGYMGLQDKQLQLILALVAVAVLQLEMQLLVDMPVQLVDILMQLFQAPILLIAIQLALVALAELQELLGLLVALAVAVI